VMMLWCHDVHHNDDNKRPLEAYAAVSWSGPSHENAILIVQPRGAETMMPTMIMIDDTDDNEN
jgi:hypothetical protein